MFEFPRAAGRVAAVSAALVAGASLAGCSGSGGSAAAPFTPAGNGSAAGALAQRALPDNLGLTLDDAGNITGSAACTAPPPDPTAAGIILTGAAQTIHLPCFKDFTASANVPANSAKGVEVKLAVSTDKNLGATLVKADGTPIAYTAIDPVKDVNFDNSKAPLVVYVASPSQIAAPHTYTVQVWVPAFKATIQTITDIKPIVNTHEIKFSLLLPGGSFPPLEAVVVVYKTT